MLDLNANDNDEKNKEKPPINRFPRPKRHKIERISHLPRSLAIAADNLHFIGENRALVVQLEVDVLDKERPDFVAESVGVQVALHSRNFRVSLCPSADDTSISPYLPPRKSIPAKSRAKYLERQFNLHLLRKHLGDHTIKRRQNLHGKLRLNPALVDQVIERIGKRQSDTAITESAPSQHHPCSTIKESRWTSRTRAQS